MKIHNFQSYLACWPTKIYVYQLDTNFAKVWRKYGLRTLLLRLRISKFKGHHKFSLKLVIFQINTTSKSKISLQSFIISQLLTFFFVWETQNSDLSFPKNVFWMSFPIDFQRKNGFTDVHCHYSLLNFLLYKNFKRNPEWQWKTRKSFRIFKELNEKRQDFSIR